MSNVNVRVNTTNNVCSLSALDNLEFAEIPFENLDEKEDNVIYIGDQPRQWFINIPVYNEFQEKLDVPVFCDSCANVACIDANFAVDHFYTFIKRNTKKTTLQIGLLLNNSLNYSSELFTELFNDNAELFIE